MEDTKNEPSIWVVITHTKYDTEPIVAIWDNADAAEQNYKILVNVFGETHTYLKRLPICSTFRYGS